MVAFGTKSETLERLSSTLSCVTILPQIKVSAKDWPMGKQNLLKLINERSWLSTPLIVRSSAKNEDGFNQSLAGNYLSVLNVVGLEQMEQAINRVFQSYGHVHADDQVFIQPMLQEVIHSGVAFSKDPNTGGSYFVVNYDTHSGSTSSVTSGSSNELETFYCFYTAEPRDPVMSRVIGMMRELMRLLQTDTLDIEYAMTSDHELYLLQVRPLVLKFNHHSEIKQQQQALFEIDSRLECLLQAHPPLLGKKSIFAVMPDWNPAEIIGTRPRPLALSLYKELITDHIWATQRFHYGYRDVQGQPLLVNFGCFPYVDVRASFTSFIPADVPEPLAERLCEFYLDKLSSNPSLHDKVEFEIVYSCYTFDLERRLAKLQDAGFSGQELNVLSSSLRELTNRIINDNDGLWLHEFHMLKEFERRRAQVLNSRLDIISTIYWLIEDCKTYGALPFAGLARSAFIAMQLLRSLLDLEILNTAEYSAFMESLDTVSSRMKRDFGQMSREEFLLQYGHLRPGTYDILSPRYDEQPERYFTWECAEAEEGVVHEPFIFKLPEHKMNRISELLEEHRIQLDAAGLFKFIRGAIEGREYSKFIFTRSLSDAISLIKQLGATTGLSEDDCSFLNYNILKQLYASSAAASTAMRQSVKEGRESYCISRQICLPPIIVDINDVWEFSLPVFEPNFITQKTVCGYLASIGAEKTELKDSILMIPNADPGYDWIFSHQIGSFITMYGGVNSHMAIRAGELGIPAIIGAGEALYRKWSSGSILEINCENKSVKIIR